MITLTRIACIAAVLACAGCATSDFATQPTNAAVVSANAPNSTSTVWPGGQNGVMIEF